MAMNGVVGSTSPWAMRKGVMTSPKFAVGTSTMVLRLRGAGDDAKNEAIKLKEQGNAEYQKKVRGMPLNSMFLKCVFEEYRRNTSG